MSSNETEQHLLQVLRLIDSERQEHPDVPVPATLIATQTGFPPQQVRDYFSLLQQQNKVELLNTREEFYALLTAVGRTFLRDPHFRSNPGPQAVINMPNPTFNNSLVNINSTITDTIQILGAAPNIDSNDKDQLIHLIEQLSGILETAPPEASEDAEAVADAAKSIADAVTKEKPNKKTVLITGEGLKTAAKNIAVMVPAILPVVNEIVQHISKMFP